MKSRKRMFTLFVTASLAAVFVIAGGVFSKARATDSWGFWIDCYDPALKKTGSDDKVKYTIWKGTKKVAEGTQLLKGCKPSTQEIIDYYGWDNEQRIDVPFSDDFRDGFKFQIRLEATGDNAIWIDRVQLYQYCAIGSKVGCGLANVVKGKQGGNGWCLSTDPDDEFKDKDGKKRHSGDCKKSILFKAISEGTEKTLKVLDD